MPKTKKTQESSDEVVINLDAIAIPGAIVLAGIVIALAIVFTNKGKDITTDDVAGETDNTETAQEEFAAATTVIGDSPYLGDIKKAKVAIVEYTDFQCPYCERHATDTKPSIISEYVDTGKIIYVVRNFPLDFHGQIAIDSANAALCVNELAGAEKYFEFYAQGFSKTSTAELATVAQGLGINMDKYNTCMSENRYKEQIDKDMADGASAGVQGTPGFVIGVLDKDGNVEGKLIAGAYPFESFKAIIDEMLEK
ncbi:thioredoxin domain-containing protein [Candidatus Dojkabacteria bacterium]|nr:thioredoxin domain-containing protein [Candidatus Dojkabacteria bacterium]